MGRQKVINSSIGIGVLILVVLTSGFGFGIIAPKMDWYKRLNQSVNTSERHTVISAEGFNLLYIGLENPIAIASSGFPPEDLIVSVSNGSIKRVGNNYTVKVWKRGVVYITVNAKMQAGNIVKLARKKFKVRRLPKPRALWGSVTVGPNPKVVYMAQSRVNASMGGAFAYDPVKYEVIEYKFVYIKKDSTIKDSSTVSQVFQKGNLISQEMKEHIKNGNIGDRFWIENIKAVWEKDTIKLSPSMYMISPITW